MPRQIGYAVVGCGDIARTVPLSAFAGAGENSRLVAIVSDHRPRTAALAQELGVTGYHHEELRQCLQRDDVNAVYIALPNSMHCDCAVEAARAGVHVLCEKPMAVTADECRRMLRTCQTNRVKLMIAYHLHRQPAHRKLLDLVHSGALGTPRTFSSDFTLPIDEPYDARLQRRLGGGTLYELGVYCINTARHVFGTDPAQVMAMASRMSHRGGDVDEATVALVRFPDDRLAHFHTSFGETRTATLTVLGEQALVRVSNAYRAESAVTLEVERHDTREVLSFEPTDQLADELRYFSHCILADRAPEPSGLEGVQDVRIVEAIYRSARDGRPVTLPRVARTDALAGPPPPIGASPDLRVPVPDHRQAS
jgi:glucose-fructose oxidoreductase